MRDDSLKVNKSDVVFVTSRHIWIINYIIYDGAPRARHIICFTTSEHKSNVCFIWWSLAGHSIAVWREDVRARGLSMPILNKLNWKYTQINAVHAFALIYWCCALVQSMRPVKYWRCLYGGAQSRIFAFSANLMCILTRFIYCLLVFALCYWCVVYIKQKKGRVHFFFSQW